MKYVKKMHVMLTALLFVITISIGIKLFTDPGDRLYDFFYDRTLIQFVTLLVFCTSAILLFHKTKRYFENKQLLNDFENNPNAWKENTESKFASYLNNIQNLLNAKEERAALAYATEYVQDQHNNVRKHNEFIDFLVCSLPALGLLGTMLGLSEGLFSAFSKGSIGPEATKQFVQSIGVALDTTVLAMVCAIPAGTISWLINRKEKNLIDQQEQFARNQFSLNDLILKLENQKHVQQDQNTLNEIIEIKKQVREAILGVVVDVSSEFNKTVSGIGEHCYKAIQKSVQTILEEQRTYEKTAIVDITNTINHTLEKTSVNQQESLKKSFQMIIKQQRESEITAVEKIGNKLDHTLSVLGDRYQESSRNTLLTLLKEQRAHEASSVEQMSRRLDESVKQIGAWVTKQSLSTVDKVGQELRNMTDTLEANIPGEVVIRYDRKNNTPALTKHMEVNNVA